MKHKFLVISTIVLLIISISLIGYMICDQHIRSNNSSSAGIEKSHDDSQNEEEVSVPSNISENMVAFLTDTEYTDRKQRIKSNAELTDLNVEFADIWKEKMQEYQHSIVSHYETKENSDLVERTKSSQESWELYYQCQTDYYKKAILSEYTSGSIVPIKLSNLNLNLYRSRAIFLYNLCQELMIEVESP